MESVSPIVAQLHKALTDELRSRQVLDPGSADDPIQAARSNLDEEIKAAELAFRAYEAHSSREIEALRRRRNQLAPVLRLPNETLSSTLLFAVRGFEKYTAGIQCLFTIASVCRAWRDVALGCPSLWARLERVPLPLFSLLLARSKQAPLDIIFDQKFALPLEENELSEYIALISQHAHQWRTLIFRYPVFDEIMLSLLSSAPHLEVLVLDGGPPFYAQAIDSSTLFPHSFVDHTPSLRELTLRAIFIPFTHPIYSNLVKMELDHIEYVKPGSLREFFQALEASPLLEELALGFLLFSFPSVAGPSSPVSLPRLQTLKLLFLKPSWAPTYFLSHLSIPPSAYLELAGDTELGSDLSTILPPYPNTHYNLPNLSSITTLVIQVQAVAYAMSGSSRDKDLFVFELSADPLEELAAMISNLGRVFPMPLLDSVAFGYFHLDSDQANLELAAVCRDFFDRHPTIKILACKDCHESVLEILSTTTPSLICPRLQHLTVERGALSPQRLIEIVELRAKPRKTTPGNAEAENGGGSDSVDDERLSQVVIVSCPQFTEAHISTLRERVQTEYKERDFLGSDEYESE
ncbi:hypothetical protein BOTBODRAFT_28043 [Botryobasidium botryosum FD-172 SS1]|uniref:Uncharacterized protein n=1 Tax=Botryobasidium botryosum (strain FD-172 SS1) TaxID=930990 RepID=A0A067MUP4_BOTB1|nr:hypothetical protein BOTBODRAFT_28043 [Botryobasidium botryosum FD-172 SS1]